MTSHFRRAIPGPAAGLALLLIISPMSSHAEKKLSPPIIGFNYIFMEGQVTVTSVIPDSPAAEVDMLAGDKVLSVNGVAPTSDAHYRQLGSVSPGEALSLELLLPNGTRRTVKLTKRQMLLETKRLFGIFGGPGIALSIKPAKGYILGQPANGPAHLRGQVKQEGTPLSNVRVALIAAGTILPWALSDKTGYFDVSIPTGPVTVSGAILAADPELEGKTPVFRPDDWKNVKVDLGFGDVGEIPAINVAPKISLLRPTRRELISDQRVLLKWAPRAGADNYLVHVTKPSPKGPQTTEAIFVGSKPEYCCYDVSADQLNWKHNYFSWFVEAFDRDGRIMATSDKDDGSFVFLKAKPH